MTWNDVAKFIGNAAPVLGGALAGNLGEKAGEIIAKALGVDPSPDKVIDALKNDPNAIVRVKEIESNERVKLAEIQAAAGTAESVEATRQLQAINETMRAETLAVAGQAWYQKAWRPMCGFAVAIGSILSIVFMFILFYQALTSKDLGQNLIVVINVIPSLAAAIALILGIPGAAVGIASWHRGKMQRIEAGEAGK